MQIIQDFLTQNECINEQSWSLARELIDRYLMQSNQRSLLDHVRLLHISPRYIDWTSTTRIFGFISLSEIERLRTDSNTFLLFDLCLEGFSAIHDQPYFEMLYYNADHYGVPCHKIFFVSGNIKDDDNLATVNSNRTSDDSINAISTTALELSVRDSIFGAYYAIDRMLVDPFEYFKTRFELSYQGKWFSSLSRVIRPHRAIATYMLTNSPWADKAIISHDRINETITHWPGFEDLDPSEVKRWQDTLPLIADTTDFSINQAMNINGPLHLQTLFQIVNETMVDDRHGTSLFYSEKTFKPIGHLQPFIIYGQPGCNRALTDLGYKLYTDWFDYAFDDEPDHIKRYQLLLQSVDKACCEIADLPTNDLITWRYRNQEVLKHNFATLKQSKFAMFKAKMIVDRLVQLSK